VLRPSSGRRWAQSGENEADQASDGSLGWEFPSGSQGAEAIPCELVWRDVASHGFGVRRLGEYIAHEPMEMPLRRCDVPAAMEGARHFAVVVLVLNERVGMEDSLQSLANIVLSVAELGEMFQVPTDLALVPSEKDRFDIWEVLVQRGAADARLLGDLRHRDRAETVLGDESDGRRESGLADSAPMRVDRLVPDLRHGEDFT
jgi:hypothetical protein